MPTLIAFDYFFPTNFPDLRIQGDFAEKEQQRRALKAKVEGLLADWTANNEVVLIGDLPISNYFQGLRDENNVHVGDEVLEYLRTCDTAAPLKTILDTLSAPEYLEGVSIVNAILEEQSLKSEQIEILSIRDLMSDYLSDYQIHGVCNHSTAILGAIDTTTRGDLPLPTEIFSDTLHLNDMGQAFVFNHMIWPRLSEALEGKGLDLSAVVDPSMPLEEVSEAEAKQIMLASSESKSNFIAKSNGAYWADFTNFDNFSLRNVELHIPSAILGAEQDMKITAERRKDLQELITQINDPDSKKGLIELLGIADLIDPSELNWAARQAIAKINPRSSGIRVIRHEEGQVISLDLTKAIFYIDLPLQERESQQEYTVYEAWG
ncbi:MAG: hypothetical protein HRT45_19640, partial [Bdellovibrionales bacterium]|nr:hypothetical protein [Bdellovibrionales bacterium]